MINILVAFVVALFLSAVVLFFCFAGEKGNPDKYPDWVTSLTDTCWMQTNSRAFPGQKKNKIEIRFGKKFADDGTLTIFFRGKGSDSTGSTLGYMRFDTFVHGKKNIGLPQIKVTWNATNETIVFKDGELSYIFTRMSHWFAKTK